MPGPNHCNTCEYRQYPAGGHCYLYRRAPESMCRAHTARKAIDVSLATSSGGPGMAYRDLMRIAAFMASR
jgi:hypothetical protein